MMNDVPVLGAVIVTYNRRDLLLECLRANLAQQKELDIIIVVDNASSDGTREALESSGMLSTPCLHYHRLESNQGGAGGFCFGLQKAMENGCDWIWLMDDDAMPEPDALKQLLDHLPETERPPILASQVVNRGGQTDLGHRGRVQLRPPRNKHVPASEYQQPTFEIDVATFVGPLIHRQHVEACGLPRADFFIYYDDLEYTYRIRRAGFRIIVVPQSRVRHLDEQRVGADAMRDRNWDWRMYYKMRNRVYWYRDIGYGPCSTACRLFLIILNQLRQILLRAPTKVHRARLLLRAVADGWHGRLGKTIDPAAYQKPGA